MIMMLCVLPNARHSSPHHPRTKFLQPSYAAQQIAVDGAWKSTLGTIPFQSAHIPSFRMRLCTTGIIADDARALHTYHTHTHTHMQKERERERDQIIYRVKHKIPHIRSQSIENVFICQRDHTRMYISYDTHVLQHAWGTVCSCVSVLLGGGGVRISASSRTLHSPFQFAFAF